VCCVLCQEFLAPFTNVGTHLCDKIFKSEFDLNNEKKTVVCIATITNGIIMYIIHVDARLTSERVKRDKTVHRNVMCIVCG
jgi:hypothetical protein